MMITLNEISIDLEKDIDFHHILNSQQIGALETMVEFIESSTQICTMQGSAGVGKTTIVKILLHYLMIGRSDRMPLLCAPTHKARMVLQRASNEQVATIHSILNLKPNLDVALFDARELDFLSEPILPMFAFDKYKKQRVGIPYKGLLIIDEASMINDDLFDLISKRCKEKQCKVLFIGDIAQLQPVKQGGISKVFVETDDKFTIKLTKVERQADGNPLLEVLTVLRDKPVFKYTTHLVNNVGIIQYDAQLEFFRAIKNIMNPDAIIADPYRSRILTYTNKNVVKYNRAIRKIMGYTDEIVVGDLLMAFDNFGKATEPVLTNSCDYLVLNKKDYDITIPEFGIVPGYRLELRDLAVIDGTDKKILFLIRNDLQPYIYEAIATAMERIRVKAMAAKKAGKSWAGMLWKQFYSINETVASMQDLVYDGRVIKKKCISYGYAHTIHKSQGATYDNVFVDMTDITKCSDQNELRQLQYVALSRARNKAHILT